LEAGRKKELVFNKNYMFVPIEKFTHRSEFRDGGGGGNDDKPENEPCPKPDCVGTIVFKRVRSGWNGECSRDTCDAFVFYPDES